MVLASYHPLKLFQFVRYSFLPIRSISGVDFCFASPEAIVPEEFFVLTFQLPLSSYPGASVKYSLSARDLFVLLHLNPLEHIGYTNPSWCFILCRQSFPDSYGGSFKILFP